MPREIEWPPNSGRKAVYEDHEIAAMTALREQAERGEITAAELRNQVDVMHALKVDLDATMVKDTSAPEHFEQDSLFAGMVPQSVKHRLKYAQGPVQEPVREEPKVEAPTEGGSERVDPF